MKLSMIRIRLLVSLFLISALLSSCGKISKIEVGEVSGFKIKGFEENALAIEVNLPVKNPSCHKIRVTGFNAKIYINKSYLGRINSIDPILIPGRSSNNYDVVFYVRISNPFGAVLTMMNLHQGQKINIKIEGEITSKTTVLKKKLQINEDRDVVL
jgi:LEA14-like dessication related protein